MSPKNVKRQKVQDKQEKFSMVMKPLNIPDCDFECIPDPDLQQFNQKIDLNAKTAEKGPKLYKKIDGEYFIDNAETKFEMRHLNVIDISQVDIVLVSTFNDLYAIPFITRIPHFKGVIMMTQALQQIGLHLLKEFVSQNAKRNMKKDSQSSFLKLEKM